MTDYWANRQILDPYKVIKSIMGDAIKRFGEDEYWGHPIFRIAYDPAFDLQPFEPAIREGLDNLDWQLLTTGATAEVIKTSEKRKSFGIAPIQEVKVLTAYHATRVCIIEKIVAGKDDLLPSNEDRRSTNFPDTLGRIHVCQTLNETENKYCAEWWMQELSKKNRFDDPNYGIIKINMETLIARVYQDLHSPSGLIIDRIERISAELIERVK